LRRDLDRSVLTTSHNNVFNEPSHDGGQGLFADLFGLETIRNWLIDLDEAQLQSSLGLTLEDILILRGGTPIP